jgi:hypothetical protein
LWAAAGADSIIVLDKLFLLMAFACGPKTIERQNAVIRTPDSILLSLKFFLLETQ